MRVLTILIALLATSCFKPKIGEGDYHCGTGADVCPPGFGFCNTCDDRCYSTQPAAGCSIDASIPPDAKPGTPDAKPKPDSRPGQPDAKVFDAPTGSKPDARKGKDGGVPICNHNGSCDPTENCTTCPQDCGSCTVCNHNGVCDIGESCVLCPVGDNCCPTFGDGGVVFPGDSGTGCAPCDGGTCACKP